MMNKELFLNGTKRVLKAYDNRLFSILESFKEDIIRSLKLKPFLINSSTTQEELTNAFNRNRELYYSTSKQCKSKVIQIILDQNSNIQSFYVLSIENGKAKIQSFSLQNRRYIEIK